MTKPAADAS